MGCQFFLLGNFLNSFFFCFEEGNGNVIREVEKRRRVVVVVVIGEDGNNNGGFSLKLGENGYDFNGEREGKKTKFGGGSGINYCLVCQVESCEVDFSKVKDYYRCYKVCEMYFKVISVFVVGIM